MLTVDYQDHIEEPVSATATQVIVRNDLKEIIAFVIQLDGNKCIASHFGDEGFTELLTMFDLK